MAQRIRQLEGPGHERRLGYDEPVDPHQGAKRRIHRLEVGQQHLTNLATDAHLCPAAEIGRNDLAELLARGLAT